MSLDALAWARAQKVGCPLGKSLLRAIAAYADEDNKCWPSRRRLSEDTELSLDTIDRRMKELEELGFLRREKRTGDSGREMSRTIILLFDVQKARAQMAENRTGQPHGGAALQRPSQPHYSGPPSRTTAAPPAATVRHQEESLEESKEEAPSSSPVPAHAGSEEEEGDLRIDSEFADLTKAYPVTDDMDLAVARRQFEALKVKERQLAIRMAARFREAMRAPGGRTKAKFLENWLRDRNFEEIQKRLQTQAEAQGLERPRVFVKRGTEAWAAWNAYRRATEARFRDVRGDCYPVEQSKVHGGTGFWFPSLFPPPLPQTTGVNA